MIDSAGLHTRFRSVFGHTPQRVWAAPGRVTVIGDHTDYQGGVSLAVAVPYHVVVAAHDRADGVVRAQSGTTAEAFQQTTADIRGTVADALRLGQRLTGLAGFVGAVFDLMGREKGSDILVEGTLPPGSGLSSSAALSLGLLGALSTEAEPQPDWARLAQVVENRYLGVPSGILDQLAILYARPGHAVLIDARRRTAVPVPFDWSAAGMVLLVIDTGMARRLADTPYGIRVAEAARAAEAMGLSVLVEAQDDDLDRIRHLPVLHRRARHVVGENRRVRETVQAAGCDDWATVTRLIRDSHSSLRDDYGVSTDVLDETCRTVAELDGRAGARVTGAGFGGSAVALVPGPLEAEVRAAVQSLYRLKGWGSPQIRRVDRPAGGLERLV